jgi:nucleotide-binding universal stress UspA family protein
MEALEKKWVMACVDGSLLSQSVVDYAAWIAEKVGSPLELVHAIEQSRLLEHTDHSGNLTPNIREDLFKTLSDDERAENKRLLEAGKHMLEQAKSRLAGRTIKDVRTKQRHGGLSDTVSDLESEIRVLVLGLRGEDHDSENKGIGTHLEHAIRAVHRPIFIVSEAFSEPKSLMFAYNDTEGAQKALDMVCRSPLYQRMEIHVVHVSGDEAKGRALLARAEQQLQNTNLDYRAVWLSGNAQTELLAYQQQHAIDMTMMGAFSHGKLSSLFFGSFTLNMLAHHSKPILLMR